MQKEPRESLLPQTDDYEEAMAELHRREAPARVKDMLELSAAVQSY
jgi:hypothetical protein